MAWLMLCLVGYAGVFVAEVRITVVFGVEFGFELVTVLDVVTRA